jgi:hypothetical protein
MWLLIIVTLITGTDGGASSSVTTLRFSTEGNCVAAAKAVAPMGEPSAAAPMRSRPAACNHNSLSPLKKREEAEEAAVLASFPARIKLSSSAGPRQLLAISVGRIRKAHRLGAACREPSDGIL